MNQNVPLTVLSQMDNRARLLMRDASYSPSAIQNDLLAHFARFEPDAEDARASIKRIKREQSQNRS